MSKAKYPTPKKGVLAWTAAEIDAFLRCAGRESLKFADTPINEMRRR